MLKNFRVIDLNATRGSSMATFDIKRIKFNRATADEMQYPSHICMLLDAKGKRFAIQACDASSANAIKFSKERENQKYTIFITQPTVQAAVKALMGWGPDEQFKVSGVYYPSDKAMIFDLNHAVPTDKRKKKDEEA